jgi:hypothetical protein
LDAVTSFFEDVLTLGTGLVFGVGVGLVYVFTCAQILKNSPKNKSNGQITLPITLILGKLVEQLAKITTNGYAFS